MKIKILIGIITTILLLFIGMLILISRSSAIQVRKYMKLGNKYLFKKRYNEAIIEFNKILKIEPQNIEARLACSDAYVAIEKYDEAEELLEEVIKIDKTVMKAYESLIDIYVKKGVNEDILNKLLIEVFKG